MNKAVTVSNADGSATGVVVEVYDKGSDGQADTLTATYLLANLGEATQLGLTAGSYLIVRTPSADEAAKSIDNWAQAPQPDRLA